MPLNRPETNAEHYVVRIVSIIAVITLRIRGCATDLVISDLSNSFVMRSEQIVIEVGAEL